MEHRPSGSVTTGTLCRSLPAVIFCRQNPHASSSTQALLPTIKSPQPAPSYYELREIKDYLKNSETARCFKGVALVPGSFAEMVEDLQKGLAGVFSCNGTSYLSPEEYQAFLENFFFTNGKDRLLWQIR